MIAVTGANGYVGGRIVADLRARGLDPIALVRRPAPGDAHARRYALAQPLDRAALDGVETVIHAAYDLSVRGELVRAVNYDGSLPLLDGLAARGGRAVLISSLSAFEGAPSLYGQTKLELERAVLARGGCVLRPGLVFGTHAAGLFGAMLESLSSSGLAPLVGGGWQRLFVTHDLALCKLVAETTAGRVSATGPVFAAHEVPTTLRAIAREIAAARGRRLRVIPVPSPLAYLGLRSLELTGLRLPFRSDSVRSLQSPIPLDQVAALERTTVEFPPLRPELWARTLDDAQPTAESSSRGASSTVGV
jgi:nucleoside-diphosphate-sugar epimerase